MLARVFALWRSRWGLLRLVIAGALAWVLVADTGARLARESLRALPDFDYVAEAASLRSAGRFSESALVAEEGLDRLPRGDARRADLERERGLTIEARDAWSRRAADLAKGVALGAGEGASLERLVGAVGADFFVIGDIRDLAVQGWRFATGGETDGVIAALSAVGLVTTLAPEIDWAPSILKAARRTGALGERLGGWIVRAVRGREVRAIEALVTDTATIAKHSNPATAARLLRLADEPADVARIAGFVGREGRAGAFALEQTGRAGAGALREAEALRAALRGGEAVRVERAVVAAAGKGKAGSEWLARGAYRALTRPHPIVGVAKAVWSGHAADLVEKAIERFDPGAVWAIPALAAWIAFELGLIARRLCFVRGGAARGQTIVRPPSTRMISPVR